MRTPSRWSREGARRASRLADRFGSELRLARATWGLTQAQVADMVGIDQSFVSLIEHGLRRPTWRTACALAAAVGHDISVKLYPSATVRLRDSGQLGCITQILQVAHASWHRAIEFPVAHSSTDRRAADLLLSGPSEVLHVEVERRLVDFQAQLRSAQLKRVAIADQVALPVRLVIAVPDTRRMRELIASEAAIVAAALPARSSAVWRSIRTGIPLTQDGLLFVRNNRK